MTNNMKKMKCHPFGAKCLTFSNDKKGIRTYVRIVWMRQTIQIPFSTKKKNSTYYNGTDNMNNISSVFGHILRYKPI